MVDGGHQRVAPDDPSHGSVRVHVLGEFATREDGREADPLSSARARSLVGFLVCHPDEWHTRQRLAFMLWPDSDESQARTNLRNVLHLIRRGVPAVDRYLESTAGLLRWRSDPTCWVDIAAFLEAAERAERADQGSTAELDALREAKDIYRGDLLEDCYDDWVVAERERLRDRMVAVLRRLAEALSEDGQHADAIVTAREVTRMAPLEEDGYRLRMRVHHAADDLAGVMRVFHECAAVLRQELAVEPSPSTRRMFTELTRVETGAGERPVAAEAALVGRTREFAELQSRWVEAEHGQSRFVLMGGEAGVGKTRLAEELAAWVTHRGATVCSARAYPAEGDLGFGVVASWLRTPAVMSHLRRLGRTHVAELARVLPELGEPRRLTAASGDDGDRLRLFDACAAAITQAGGPVLLVCDDAQWSDAPSLQFVHFLLRNPPRGPLLVLATVRREDLERNHPLHAVTNGLEVLDRVRTMDLERLDRAATMELARSVLGSTLDDVTGDALFEDTEGNPLFIVETLRAQADAGPHIGMTAKLRAVIEARLDRLADDAHALLDLAATVGRAFTPALVARAGGFDDQTVVRALDELWRRGLIREQDQDAYDFSHGKIRDAAYDALSPATRRRNHLAIARALELDAGASGAVSGLVAVNFDRGGAVSEAIEWYGRAARHALLRSAYGEAVRFLERAQELAARLDGPLGMRKELDILAALSPAIAAADSYASPRQDDVVKRATELSAVLQVELDPALLRSRVLMSLCRNEFDDAQAAAVRLLDTASRAHDDGLTIESHYLLGISAFWGCDLTKAREHFEIAIDRFGAAERVGHTVRFGHDPRIVCTSRLANTLWFLGDTDQAVATRERAMRLAAETPHPYSANVAKVFAAVLAVDMGDPDDIRYWAAELAHGGDRSWLFELNASAFNGYVDALDGRSVGLRRLRAAIDALGGAAPAPGAISTLTRVLVGAHEVAGDTSGGLAAADRALALEGTRLWEAELRRLRAVFLAASGAGRDPVRSELLAASQIASARSQLGPAARIAATRFVLERSTD
jgi:DNA-binding SARP family transcriptional activator/tetratricopeptide (TPR) repeat protein